MRPVGIWALTVVGALAALAAFWLWSGRARDDALAPRAQPETMLAPTQDVHEPSASTPAPTATRNASAAPSPSPEVEKGLVSFADGQVVPVSFAWVHPAPPPIELRGSLSEHYAELRILAESGNPAAARTLHRALRGCQRAHVDESSLNQAIELLKRERVLKETAVSTPTPLDPGEDINEIIEAVLKRPYEFCKGITLEQRNEAPRWAEAAAKAGDYLGLQDWAVGLGDTEAAAEAWLSIWERGYISALPPLSKLYAAGVPASASGKPNFIHAYAFKYINLRIMEAKYGDSPTAMQRRMLGAVEDSLRYTGGFLTPEQTAAAIDTAQRLLKANRNCCVGSW